MAKATARHILVSSKEKCEDLKKQIESGQSFEKLAGLHSECPSGQDGGNLGEFEPGQMVEEFDEIVFSKEIGKVYGPIKTEFGYHLIEIISRSE
ncbi:MAG: peptidylprolyl isomerase [Candidatus Omnitrophica bacterium]|jgi:peptidyl-prolyl cis-trans isomerase C|nr:peptidylprolyl isomerase [Candidatus Omnitrophota bacterium]